MLRRGADSSQPPFAGWREATHSFYMGQGWTDNGKWFVKLLDESWGAAGYSE